VTLPEEDQLAPRPLEEGEGLLEVFVFFWGGGRGGERERVVVGWFGCLLCVLVVVVVVVVGRWEEHG
jgi:hypothetical protein